MVKRDERLLRALVEDGRGVELELGQRGAALEERINSLARARTPPLALMARTGAQVEGDRVQGASEKGHARTSLVNCR